MQQWTRHLRGVPLSYAQIYFANSVGFGLALMLVSFADIGVGVSGLITIVVCHLCTVFFNFNRAYIFDGAYTFNALMVGLAMGGLYQLSAAYIIVLVIAAMLCFFFTVWLSGRLAASGLPMLSLPFLLTIWIIFLGVANFSEFGLAGKQQYSLQEWYPQIFSWISGQVDRWPFHDAVHLYLRSLSAIFFQYNDLAGAIIALALLRYSRISFALTVYGFLIGYFFYYYLEGDFTPLVYSYIGFNFMLTAIALGGFFLVPSAKSHLLLLFVVPVTALLLSGLHTVFSKLSLPLFSLPFNIIVVVMVGALHMRFKAAGLQLVQLQQYRPELNHYKSIYFKKRFQSQTFYHISLPVMGEWNISQGHNGAITHKEEWQHAWDFDVRDQEGFSYRAPGQDLKDFYCYDLPVVAPSYGWVVKVFDGVADNMISDINLAQNWGNTIVIKHAEGLYSKLSHLKPHSILVKEGDYVSKGELIAHCGSSGRSPEPHLHFQLQATPYIGSRTLRYPIAYYLVKNRDAYEFHAFDYPREGQVLRNVVLHPLLAGAFAFVAGKELKWMINEKGKDRQEVWTLHVDAYNKQYVYCKRTGSVAYFVNDGTLFYFTDFYGEQSSFLHRFYLHCQKVLLGWYPGVLLEDWLMPASFFGPVSRALQDFAAPFFHFLTGSYQCTMTLAEGLPPESGLMLRSVATGKFFNRVVKSSKAELLIGEEGIIQVKITNKKGSLIARCVA